MSRNRFNDNNNIQLLPPQMQQPQVVVASPFNDIQLLAMVAANCIGQPVDQVERAIEIVAHSILAGGRLQARVQELAAAQQPKITE